MGLSHFWIVDTDEVIYIIKQVLNTLGVHYIANRIGDALATNRTVSITERDRCVNIKLPLPLETGKRNVLWVQFKNTEGSADVYFIQETLPLKRYDTVDYVIYCRKF